MEKNTQDWVNLEKSIDAKISELEEGNSDKERKTKKQLDQTGDAINAITECVNNILDIENIDEIESLNLLEIISWFNYLKEYNQDSKEYNEAKKLILSIGEKHPKLNNWCQKYVEKSLSEYETLYKDIDLNVSKNNECQIEDGLKVIFDTEEVKKYIDALEAKNDSLNSCELNYKIIYNEEEYNYCLYFENNISKLKNATKCPYKVFVNNGKIDENGDYIISFYIIIFKVVEKSN